MVAFGGFLRIREPDMKWKPQRNQEIGKQARIANRGKRRIQQAAGRGRIMENRWNRTEPGITEEKQGEPGQSRGAINFPQFGYEHWYPARFYSVCRRDLNKTREIEMLPEGPYQLEEWRPKSTLSRIQI